MNCKIGDIVEVIKENEYLAAALGQSLVGERAQILSVDHEHDSSWILLFHRPIRDTVISGTSLTTSWYDPWLRPIRDADGTDEILRIAGKPQSIESPNKVTV